MNKVSSNIFPSTPTIFEQIYVPVYDVICVSLGLNELRTVAMGRTQIPLKIPNGYITISWKECFLVVPIWKYGVFFRGGYFLTIPALLSV
jgi:hypothetical protein